MNYPTTQPGRKCHQEAGGSLRIDVIPLTRQEQFSGSEATGGGSVSTVGVYVACVWRPPWEPAPNGKQMMILLPTYLPTYLFSSHVMVLLIPNTHKSFPFLSIAILGCMYLMPLFSV
jgi:hypothetical protein